MNKYIGIMLLSVLPACTMSHKQTASTQLPDTSRKYQTFPVAEIPVVFTTEEQRLEYLTLHFWSKYDFSDTILIDNQDVTEQGLANYLSLLTREGVGLTDIRESMGNFCRLMEVGDYSRGVFMNQMDRYLFDPNSPMYNEHLYMQYLQCMMESRYLDDARKSSLEFTFKLISRNMPGEKASAFTYIDRNGDKQSLYRTPVLNNRLLLIFYDPECPHCHEILQQIVSDKQLTEAVSSRRLTVLAIYTEGNIEAWNEACRSMPCQWIIGTDQEQIKQEALYDLKAMPAIYLLDADKRVLLKDAPYALVRRYLFEN